MSWMKRKIMRGGMRGRKAMLLSIAAMAVALASLASLAGPAQAFDTRSCFGYGYGITDVDQFKMKTGSVDFGDGWHLFGSPTGDAVVCWGEDGSINIRGRLYADSPTPFQAGVDVRYFRTDGSYSTSPKSYVTGEDGENQLTSFVMPGAVTVDRVRIRLWNCGNTIGSANPTCNLVEARTFHRGDINIE